MAMSWTPRLSRGRVLFIVCCTALWLVAPAEGQDPDYVLNAPTVVIEPGQEGVASFTIDNGGDPVIAFSFGVQHDPLIVTATEVFEGVDLGASDFFLAELWSNGFTVGLIVSFSGTSSIPVTVGFETVRVVYQANQEGASPLEYVDTLGGGPGLPPVEITVVIGMSPSTTVILPVTNDGSIEVAETTPMPLFIRGDANSDLLINLADPIRTLDYLFQGNPVPCLAALDTNDDEGLDLADPIYGLSYLFSTGPAPAAPFPGCGLDATPSGLSCLSPSACSP